MNLNHGAPCPDEWKFAEADGEATFAGYGSTFGNIDNGRDMVMPGAFSEITRKVKFLWMHDASKPIGTLSEVSEDSRGLKVKGRFLTTTQAGREAYELAKAGVVDGLSIGFRALAESYDSDRQKRPYRKIEKADLWEVSLVTFGMNPKAGLTAVKAMPSDRELEALLRDEARLSHRDAKAAVAVFRTLRDGEAPADKTPRDAGEEAIIRGLDDVLAALRS